MKKKPLISVALCTFNGEEYVEEQLLSIIEQTVQVDEIIISDDNSVDKTIEIARKILKDYNIKHEIIINDTRLGVVKNFQQAIGMCMGDIIFLSDQDDIWIKHKVAKILEEFSKNQNLIMVFSDAELINEYGKSLKTRLWSTLDFSIDVLKNKKFIEVLLNRSIVTGATMAFKKKLYYHSIPFSNYWIHDGWLALNSSLYGEIVALKDPLIKYRQHSKNVIGASKKTSLKRIKNYINNMKSLEVNRRERLERYKDFLDFNKGKLDSTIYMQVYDCINFWQDLVNLKEISKYERLKIMFKHLLNKNYNKYYTGFRGFIRDFIFESIKK